MKIYIALSFLFLSFNIIAQESEIITDRPNQAESPFTIDRGTVQIESGLLFERYEVSNTVAAHRSAYPTNLFRIGLVNRLELRLVNEVVGYRTINTGTNEELAKVSGTENMHVGLKYQLTGTNRKTAVGVVTHAILPTGSKGISNERYGVYSRINISHEFTDKKYISTNLGYNNYDLDFTEDGLVRKANGNFTYTFVYGVGIGERLGLYVEAFGDLVEFEDWESNMDAGMTYLLKENIQIDYSYGWGVNRIMNYHSIGISVRLPK